MYMSVCVCVCVPTCVCEQIQYKCCWFPHVHKHASSPCSVISSFHSLDPSLHPYFPRWFAEPYPILGCWHLFWFSHLGICVCNRVSHPVRSPEFGLKMRLAFCQVGFPGTFPGPTCPATTLTKGHSGYWGAPGRSQLRGRQPLHWKQQKKMGNFLFPWVGFQMLLYLSFSFPLWLFLYFSSASSSSSCRSVFQTRKQRIRWMRKRSSLMPKKQDKIATCSKMPPKFV